MSNVLEYILSMRDQFSATLQKAGVVSDATRQKITGVENEVNNLDKGFRNAANGGIKIFDVALGNLAANVAMKLGQIAESTFDGVYKYYAQREQDIVGLSTFVGKQARQVYDNIISDAMPTPFTANAFIAVNRALISTGLDANAARKDTLNLANAIAATGGHADELERMAVNMQQIRNAGKATALDVRQFAYAGINIDGLLEKVTGKSKAQLQQTSVTYQQISQALAAAAAKGGLYYGALEKQGKTLTGRLTTIKDVMQRSMADFGEQLRPLFEKGLIYLQKFVDHLPQIYTVLRPVITAAGNLFFGLINTIVSVGKFFGWLYDKLRAGNPIVVGLTVVVGSLVAAYILMQTWSLLCTAATTLWTGAQWLLNAALTANPVGLIIAGIVALIALIGYVIYRYSGWGNAWKALMGFLVSEWGVFKSTFYTIWLQVENFFLNGIETIEKAWYKLEALWDKDASQKGLANIANNALQRQAEIAASKGQTDAFRQAAQTYYAQIKLTDTGKGLKDMIGDVKSKLGIAPASIPGAGNVKSSLGSSDGDTGNAGKAASTIATGGQRNITVNMTVQKMIDGFKIIVDSTEQGIDNLQDRVTEAVTRAVSMGAALGAS